MDNLVQHSERAILIVSAALLMLMSIGFAGIRGAHAAAAVPDGTTSGSPSVVQSDETTMRAAAAPQDVDKDKDKNKNCPTKPCPTG